MKNVHFLNLFDFVKTTMEQELLKLALSSRGFTVTLRSVYAYFGNPQSKATQVRIR